MKEASNEMCIEWNQKLEKQIRKSGNDDDDERHKLQINAKYRKHAQFCASIAHLSHVCCVLCISALGFSFQR